MQKSPFQTPPSSYLHSVNISNATSANTNGTVNPLEKKTVRRAVAVDSLYRKFYGKTKSTDFLFTLPETINKVVGMKIAAVEFPNSWYMFSDKDRSNEFTITLHNVPTPSDIIADMSYAAVITHKIVIPEGNYRADLFQQCLNNLFSNIRMGLEYLYVDVNEIDTRVLFRTKNMGDDIRDIYLDADLPENFYFTIDFQVENESTRPLFKNAGWMMGFREPFYEIRRLESTVIFGQNIPFGVQQYNWYLRSESSYGSNLQNYVFLELDDFNRNYVTNTFCANNFGGSYLGDNIMGRITVSSGMNTIVTNTGSDLMFKTREYFGPVKLEKLHIRLLNKHGEPIDLNGNDFSFMLELEVLYS